ncbi:MAG: hypothetical protein IPL20_16365 [Saprospiraceae bacterium]|nr:hypothetical protein [Saprospiraceae bacterium]
MANKIYLLGFFLILKVTTFNAQNAGIGNYNPAYKLDITGTLRLQHSNSTAGFWLDGTTMPTRSFIGTLNDSHFGIYGNGGAGWNFLVNNNNNNVGIGTSAPLFRLDINGRMRIQNSANSAGIWFDGNTLPVRSFIGIMNDTYTGIYGGGGSGWNFVMNATNGNTGIGTTAPTAKLDLNGSLRIRSNSPVRGSELTSGDSNGNAEWNNPISFRADGTINIINMPISSNNWTKVQFNQSPAYNLGNDYQPASSEFVVAENGIYEFKAEVSFDNYSNRKQSIRVISQRNGVNSTIGQLQNQGIFISNIHVNFYENMKISVEVYLIAGDKVWIEAYVEPPGPNQVNINSNPIYTWFSGNIVSRI